MSEIMDEVQGSESTSIIRQVISNEILLIKTETFDNDVEYDMNVSTSFNNLNDDYKVKFEIDAKEIQDNDEEEEDKILLTTTVDECMAVEALRQLGDEKTVCTNCNAQFLTTADLESHNSVCTGGTTTLNPSIDNVFHSYRCVSCLNTFDNEDAFNSHACDRTERDYYPFKCKKCKKCFPRLSSLTNHSKIHRYQPGRALLKLQEEDKWNDPNTNTNDVRQEKTVTKEIENDLLVNGLRSTVGKIEHDSHLVPTVGKTDERKPYNCTQCGVLFSREKALISHLNLHLIVKESANDFSDKHERQDEIKSFMSKKNDKKHNVTITEHHRRIRMDQHQCLECLKYFNTKQNMIRHMWTHRKKVYECEMCTMVFDTQSDLAQHRLAEHPNDSPFVCNVCGKSFASRQGLWDHSRMHDEEGKKMAYSCTMCPKMFSSRQGFLIHIRAHKGERPYGCRFCEKAFRDGGTLRKHERIHTGERPHICPLCGHDFNQKVVLREHVRWVHTANKVPNKEGLFVCSVCDISMSDREQLCFHIVKHSDHINPNSNTNIDDHSNNIPLLQKRKRKLKLKSKSKSNLKKTGTKLIEESMATFEPEENTVKNDIVEETEPMDPDEPPEIDSSSVPEEFVQTSFESNDFGCGLCEMKFVTQKELVDHVYIHI